MFQTRKLKSKKSENEEKSFIWLIDWQIIDWGFILLNYITWAFDWITYVICYVDIFDHINRWL